MAATGELVIAVAEIDRAIDSAGVVEDVVALIAGHRRVDQPAVGDAVVSRAHCDRIDEAAVGDLAVAASKPNVAVNSAGIDNALLTAGKRQIALDRPGICFLVVATTEIDHS